MQLPSGEKWIKMGSIVNRNRSHSEPFIIDKTENKKLDENIKKKIKRKGSRQQCVDPEPIEFQS